MILLRRKRRSNEGETSDGEENAIKLRRKWKIIILVLV